MLFGRRCPIKRHYARRRCSVSIPHGVRSSTGGLGSSTERRHPYLIETQPSLGEDLEKVPKSLRVRVRRTLERSTPSASLPELEIRRLVDGRCKSRDVPSNESEILDAPKWPERIPRTRPPSRASEALRLEVSHRASGTRPDLVCGSSTREVGMFMRQDWVFRGDAEINSPTVYRPTEYQR